jgi:D-3-phosphoglycerate dehydrogenase
MKKVLLSQPIHEAGMKLLEGRVEVIVSPDTSEETVRKLSRDVNGILVRTASRLSRQTILEAPDLEVIARTGVGVDNIDVEAATERNIPVCYTPEANAISVAVLPETVRYLIPQGL